MERGVFMNLLSVIIIGFIGLLFAAGGVAAIFQGAPIIGFIIVCLVVGLLVVFLSGIFI